MAKKLETVFVHKKNDGLELEYRLNYLTDTSKLSSVDKIRIQEWVKLQVRNQLLAFKMQFPEIG